MIDFSRSELPHLAVHHVGNKGIGEDLSTSADTVKFKDDFVKETVMKYLLTPFKQHDLYYHFRKADTFSRNIAEICADLFKNRTADNFVMCSQQAAELLYNQSMHPKIKGGEFYTVYLKDVVCDGELVDAIGFFKTEKHATFLKVELNNAACDVDCDSGISIDKIDKACLVFNTQAESGYKISIVDNNNKLAECAMYWSEDFLDARILKNSYYHTDNMIEASISFCEESLPNTHTVEKQQEMMLRMANYFTRIDKFNKKDFVSEVLSPEGMEKQFTEFLPKYEAGMQVDLPDQFDVSATAVKKHKKHLRQVIKFDKNFHVYVHGRHDYIERGYDDEKGLKFIKLYYVNEE